METLQNKLLSFNSLWCNGESNFQSEGVWRSKVFIWYIPNVSHLQNQGKLILIAIVVSIQDVAAAIQSETRYLSQNTLNS